MDMLEGIKRSEYFMRLINDGIRPGIPQQNYGRIAAAIRHGGNFRYRITTSKKEYTFDDKPILTFRDNTLKIEYEGSAIPPVIIDFDLEELLYVEAIDYEILKKMLVE